MKTDVTNAINKLRYTYGLPVKVNESKNVTSVQYGDNTYTFKNSMNNKVCESIVRKVAIQHLKESASPEHQNDYNSLIIALESEKDATNIYTTLIDLEKSKNNTEVVELLEKILNDEKEHIALLSAMQAKQASEYVGEDAAKEYNEIVEEIPPAIEETSDEEKEE